MWNLENFTQVSIRCVNTLCFLARFVQRLLQLAKRHILGKNNHSKEIKPVAVVIIEIIIYACLEA